MDSVDGGASLGTRWVVCPSSASFSEGETSDDVRADVGLMSADNVCSDRDVVVVVPSDSIVAAPAAATADESMDSTGKQRYTADVNIHDSNTRLEATAKSHPNYFPKSVLSLEVRTS